MPVLAAGGAIGGVVMTTVGAFGTGAMPLAFRAGFWFALIGWTVVKWQAWFAWRVRRSTDWIAAAAIGTLALNLLLPIEIAVALRLFDVRASVGSLPHVWPEALVISGAILALVLLVRGYRQPSAPETVAAVDPGGIIARAGIRDPDQLCGFQAEDHFCRLYLSDKRTVLIHARFGDLLGEVDRWGGTQVHRGCWVRAGAVRGAVRSGRRWLLQLDGGGQLPVSARYLVRVREAGWLREPL